MNCTKNGIRINGKHSYGDFDLYIAERKASHPERKTITATVPYMDGYYDFSSLLGRPCYTQRTLMYAFDLVADDAVALEALKNSVCAWLETADQSEICDDDDPEYHYVGSVSAIEWAPDGENYGLLTVTFICQPYRIRNDDGTEAL